MRKIFLTLIFLLPVFGFAKEYKTIFQARKDFENAGKIYDKQTLLDLGEALVKFCLYLEAEKVFFRVIELYPQSPEGYAELYQMYVVTGQRRSFWATRAQAKQSLISKINSAIEGAEEKKEKASTTANLGEAKKSP